MEKSAVLIESVSLNGIMEIKYTSIGHSLITIQGGFVLNEYDEEAAGHQLSIIITDELDIEVTDMDAEKKIFYPNVKDRHEYRKPFLLYGLTSWYEFLTYISLDKKHKFILGCETKENCSKIETAHELERMEYYKTYVEIKKLMKQMLSDGSFYMFSLKNTGRD